MKRFSSNSRPRGENEWKDELEDEAEKRREFKDQFRSIDREVVDLKDLTERLRCATFQGTQVLSKDAEQAAGRLILIIKRKQLSMRQFYGKWKVFQQRLGTRVEINESHSACPIWGIKTKCHHCEGLLQ